MDIINALRVVRVHVYLVRCRFSLFFTLTPSMNVFAEVRATLVSIICCLFDINFKRVGFKLYI